MFHGLKKEKILSLPVRLFLKRYYKSCFRAMGIRDNAQVYKLAFPIKRHEDIILLGKTTQVVKNYQEEQVSKDDFMYDHILIRYGELA